jgi:uncharacterized repeat protein (TIGR01451 family)
VNANRLRLAIGVLAALVLPALPATAHAFPGVNGKIAFTTNRDGNSEIYSMDPDGTHLVNLTHDPTDDESAAWSPDGRTIAFTSDRNAFAVPEVYVMDADGGNVTQLTAFPTVAYEPAWSPDGRRIVFMRTTELSEEMLAVVNSDGSGQHDLVGPFVNVLNPDWSPDGRKIAFALGDAAGDFELYTVNADGTNATQLTSAGGSDPSWSPDGTQIAFTGTDSGTGSYEVFAMNADGSNRHELTHSSFSNNAAWSPDGTRVAFTSYRDFVSGDIYTMAADGTDQQRLTSSPASDYDASWQTLAPGDTTPPQIDVPAVVRAEATSSAGGVVTYSASASDPDDPIASFGCEPISGSTFALGTTAVTCTATDTHGNRATSSFDVVVEDTTPPEIHDVPADITTIAGPLGSAIVDYAAPDATDAVDGAVPVTCIPPSGSTFTLGITTVDCAATDAHGNSATALFDVTVELSRADLSVSLDGPAHDVVAGDPAGFDLTIRVSNSGPSENVGGYTLTGPLPAGTEFGGGAPGCGPAPGGFTCVASGLAAGSTDTYTVHVRVLASAAPTDHTISVAVTSKGSFDPDSGNDTAAAVVTFVGEADVAVSMLAPAAGQSAGDPAGFDYVVTVSNFGPSDEVGGYTVNGTLADGISFDGGAGCAAASVGFTCAGDDLSAGSLHAFTIHARAAATMPAGQAAASVTVHSTGTPDPNPANDADAVSVTITRSADLALGVDASQTVTAGFSTSIRLSVTNRGPLDEVGGYTVAVSFPAGVTFLGGAGCSSAAGGFVCNRGDLVAGQTDSFNVQIFITSAVPAGTIDISATVHSVGTPDANSANDSASARIMITTAADLRVSLTVPPVSETAGDPRGFDFTIGVANDGPSDFAGTYTLELPGPLGITLVSGVGCSTPHLNIIDCSGGDLAAGATATFIVHATVDASSRSGNFPAFVTLIPNGTTDPNSGNNVASATVTVTSVAADLAVGIFAPPAPTAPGQLLVLTVTVRNLGPADNTGGFQVTGTLPPDVELSNHGPECFDRPGGFGCVGSSLVSGAGVVFTLGARVLSVPTSPVSASASVSSSGTPDPHFENNTASAELNIAALADLAVSITAPSSVQTAGAPAGFDYAISVTNNGPSDNAGGYTVNGTLPVGLTFVSGNGCVPSGGGSQFACSSGTRLPFLGSNRFTVHVTIDPLVVDSTLDTRVTAVSAGTLDPFPANDTARATVSIASRADLRPTSLTATPSVSPLEASSDPSRNSVTYRFSVVNDGPSVARSVSVQASSIASDGYCVVTSTNDCTSFTQFSTIPPVIAAMQVGTSVTFVTRGHVSPSLRGGPLTLNATLTATSTTTDPNPSNSLNANIPVVTVPDQVTHLSATPGNGNAVVSWAFPARDGGAPLDATSPYILTVSGPGATRTMQVHPSAGGPCLLPDAGYCIDVTGLSNGGGYTFSVVAVNRVGTSDAVASSATPFANAVARIFAANTPLNLATCTAATVATPVCVTLYSLPKGGGGVIAARGGVPVPATFCLSICAGLVGVEAIASANSWTDVRHPIALTVNWDASLALGQGTIYAQQGSATPTALVACINNAKAIPDPCLKTRSVLGGNPASAAYGDTTATILITSDNGPLLVAQG